MLLFTINDPAKAKEFLRTWIQDVPAGLTAEVDGVAALHFMFSWSALEKLLKGRGGFDVDEGRRAFDIFFVDPANAPDNPRMASQLGFTGASAPASWWSEFKTSGVEVAVYGAFDDEAQRSGYVQRLQNSASTCGLSELKLSSFPNGFITGYRPPGGRLHFGYRDGITTPDVDWTDGGRPNSVDQREIIAGYPNADYPTSPFKPGPWQDFSREGSYSCLMWISQDVRRFEQYLTEKAPAVARFAGTADPREWLAAQLLGRWRDGTPLALHDKQQPTPPDLNNDFGYADDPSGLKCPLTAHIRIVNCRDQPLKFANRIRFPKGPPRLARRGFSYGSPWTENGNDQDRGIVGVFFCARVNEQFYTILRWMHQTDFSDVYKTFPGGSDGQDALVGDRSDMAANTMLHLVSERGESVDVGLDTFIRYRGVALLFAPGMQALATLAAP